MWLARSLAAEREYIRGRIRILFSPYAPNVTRPAPPVVLPEGMRTASGITRTSSRIARGAASVEISYLRFFHACYWFMAKYSSPMSKGSPRAARRGPSRSGRPSRRGAPTSTPQSDSRPTFPVKESSRPERAKKDSSPRLSSPRRWRRPPAVAVRTPGQGVAEDYIRARPRGRGDEGHQRGARETCYVGTGKRIPRRRGRTWKEPGNHRRIPRRRDRTNAQSKNW